MPPRGPRPPWWPADEPWPPRRPAWQVNRRAILLRVGLGFITLWAIVGILVWLGFHFAGRQWHDRGGDRPEFWVIFPIIFWSLVVVIVIWVFRRFRRGVSPLFDLIDASHRLSAGDYSVRIEPDGQPNFRNVIDAFNSMAGKLEASDQQRRRLLADIAHELRTPLAVIQGNVEGMLDDVYPRDATHLEPLLRETQLIARLLDDLQTLAQAESGTLELYREAVDPRAWLTDIVAAFGPRAAAQGVDLDLDVPGDGAEVEIDPVRMRQVLENLLANALRHTGEGGRIRVALATVPHGIDIRVSDTGSGIPAALVPHVFDRFVKAADTGGSGLGLAIARRIVEAHGGTIAAASTEGEGTTITLTVPREAPVPTGERGGG